MSKEVFFAELAVADERFSFPIADSYSDSEAAPLLCAGLIGHRSLVAAGDAGKLGLYGFGAAAHIVAQVARYQGSDPEENLHLDYYILGFQYEPIQMFSTSLNFRYYSIDQLPFVYASFGLRF